MKDAIGLCARSQPLTKYEYDLVTGGLKFSSFANTLTTFGARPLLSEEKARHVTRQLVVVSPVVGAGRSKCR